MKSKKKKNNQEVNSKFEEMEIAEELGDGWFAAGVLTGVAIGTVVVLT